MGEMKRPLEGIVVLDLSRVISGPSCCLHLADLGAEVIKVEPPAGDPTRLLLPLSETVRDGRLFFPFNRHKKSLALDIFGREGRALFLRLVEGADVLVQNFRPETLEAARLDYDSLRTVNPRLIYCSISGYSPRGPNRDRAGLDFAIQAESGLMSLNGEPQGEPLKVATSITDLQAASFAALAVCAALFARERDGRGRLVEATLFGAAVSLLAETAWDWLLAGRLPERAGNRGTIKTLLTKYFRTAEGGLVLTVPTQKMWDRFCQVEEFRHLAGDPRFALLKDWPDNLAALEGELERIFPARPTGEWVEILARGKGLICAPVRSLDQVFADPEIEAQGLVEEVEHPRYGRMRVPGPPFQLPETPLEAGRPAPPLGWHTEEVLRERLGLSNEEMAGLKARRVIA